MFSSERSEFDGPSMAFSKTLHRGLLPVVGNMCVQLQDVIVDVADHPAHNLSRNTRGNCVRNEGVAESVQMPFEPQ